MKFSELPNRNAQALVDLYGGALNQRRAAGQELLVQTLRALILGNLGGIAFLMTFATITAQKNGDLSIFLGPAWTFLLGAAFAACANFVFVVVSVDGAEHLATVVEGFVKDERDSSELIGYGFSKRGRRLFVGGGLMSVIALSVGTIWSSFALFG